MITEGNIREIYDITGLTPLAGGYEFTFPYTSAQDVRVYTTGNRTDTEVSTSNYIIDESGATPKVVFIAGYSFPAGQTKLTIIRNVSYSQKLDLRNGDLIDADKLEGALDNITQQIQQVAEKVDRAILSSVSDTEPLSIPEASQRNNMLLGFDSEGKAIPVLTTDIEQKLAQALAAEESAITAKNAAENAQHEAESAQSAAETAQGKAETAQAAAESAEASSQTLLASIETKTEESIASINTTKTGAVGAVTTQQATSVAAVQAAQNTAESDIAGKRSSALTAIDTAKTTAVAAVNTQKETSVAAADREIVAKRDSALTDIQTARTNAVNAITSQKDTSLQEIEQLASERKAEINSLAANQKADVKQYTDSVVASAKTEIDTEKTTAVTAVQEEGDAKVAIIGSSGDAEVTRVQSVYQTDLNELKKDLKSVVGFDFNINLGVFVNNSYVDRNTGEIKEYNGWHRSEYIEIDTTRKQIHFTNSKNANETYNVIYDSNKNRIVEFNTNNTIIDIPENAKYFIVSTTNDCNISASYIFDGLSEKASKKEVAKINNNVDDIKKHIITSQTIIDFDNISYTDNTYVDNTTGELVSYDEWKSTDYIEIEPKEYGLLHAPTGGVFSNFITFVYYAWYDAEKNYLQGGSVSYLVSKPSDSAKYLRMSFRKTESENIVMNTVEKLNDYIGLDSRYYVPYGKVKILGYYDFEELHTKVTENTSRIEVLESKSYELPNEFLQKCEELRIAKGSNFCFGIQTDTHFTVTRNIDSYGNNIKEIANAVGVDFIAHLGDIIQGYANPEVDDITHTRESFTELIKRYVNGVCCPFLVAIGNHDKNTDMGKIDESAYVSQDELYSRTLALAKNTFKNFSSNGRSLYYYMDFEDAKIRVIILNTTDENPNNRNGVFFISDEQVAWFRDKALNTTNSIMVLGHAPLEGTINYMVYNEVYNAPAIMSALRTFKSNGGNVIGCFWGHNHAQVSETVDGILHVSFLDTDKAEFLIVDTTNRKIETVGFGDNVENRRFTF